MSRTPVYYNEIDSFAAAWLRELIDAGQLPEGDIDERDIRDITPSDIAGYAQCHFFAGIGGWPLALRLAGWPDDRSVWTGSCPCQPFSSAGGRNGFADERHLWPSWHWLIQQCRPATVFGEQVASKAGRSWLGLVSADMEALEYSVGAADLCAAGVGAPHIRQRLFWVADREAGRRRKVDPLTGRCYEGGQKERCRRPEHSGRVGKLADPHGERLQERQERDCQENKPEQQASLRHDSGRCGGNMQLWLGDTGGIGLERTGAPWTTERAVDGPCAVVWISCQDGKNRPIKSGLEPLVDGATHRVGRLRGYGNAIVPQVAQAFIESFEEVTRGGESTTVLP